MARDKKNEALEPNSEEVTCLASTAIQDADGDAYVFTLRAHSTKTPQYAVDIGRKDNDSCNFGFAVDPYSLHKLTARFAAAVLRISKSEAAKNIRIQHATGRDDIVFALSADSTEMPRYEVDINALGPSNDGILIVIHLYGLQELTAWFARAVVRVGSYEADHPDS
jgi:hypothetical protein